MSEVPDEGRSAPPSRRPIQYLDFVDVRFADLDFYGHVNSKHYVDFVFTSRLKFMANVMKIPMTEVAERGIGFFLARSTISYKRSISGLQRVMVSSHVTEIKARKVLIVPFTISSEDGKKLYSDGVLEFALIDVKTQKITNAPDWVWELFFESAEG